MQSLSSSRTWEAFAFVLHRELAVWQRESGYSCLSKLLSDAAVRDKIAALLGSGQAGKARDFGSLIRRFESFLPSQKAPPIEFRPAALLFTSADP